MNKVCETGPPVYCPYPRRLESLIICRCHYKDSTFSSVIFKTLSVGPARIRTRDLPLSRLALSQLIRPDEKRSLIQFQSTINAFIQLLLF